MTGHRRAQASRPQGGGRKIVWILDPRAEKKNVPYKLFLFRPSSEVTKPEDPAGTGYRRGDSMLLSKIEEFREPEQVRVQLAELGLPPELLLETISEDQAAGFA